MDLGALELQIFVSLVVVLGSAFVALICDYLKGNNEQLRERNIELRVRTEERERFAILNPAAWLSQFRSSSTVAAHPAASAVAPVAAESVMESHASAESLAQVAAREAALANRVVASEESLAEAPPVAGFDVSERRRSRRKRGSGGETADKAGQNSYDWIRPEVMARVARRAGSGQREVEEEALEAAPLAPVASDEPQPTTPVAVPLVVASVTELPPPVSISPVERPAEVETVAQTQARPASTPPVIMLRPLPAMKLADELQRLAESAQTESPFTSQLLEEVIAASAAKPSAPLPVEEEIVVAEAPTEVPAMAAEPEPEPEPLPVLNETVPSVWSVADSVEVPEVAGEAITVPELERELPVEEPQPAYAYAPLEDVVEVSLPETPVLAAEEPASAPEPVYAFTMPEFAGSALADVLEAPPALAPEPPPFVEELPFPVFAAAESAEPPVVEEPVVFAAGAFPTYDSLPPAIETPAYDWSGAEFAPLPETVFASEAFAAETYPEMSAIEPEPAVAPPAIPMPVAMIEESLIMAEQTPSELLLPTGMQDVATYRRLLEMPNPMSGIVITISINEFSRLSAAVGEKELPALLDSVEVLMDSMVRDGDFGVKVSADQWVFVYRIDDNGFSQRRVAGLSEKLWDFQLRHLGLSNISFSWAAVNVHTERLSDAVTAAQERMEASRRGAKKSGAERARLVVNG